MSKSSLSKQQVQSIDEQYRAILTKVLEGTYKEYKGKDVKKMSEAAKKVRDEMRKNGELEIHFPDTLAKPLQDEIQQNINGTYASKFGTGTSSVFATETLKSKGAKASKASSLESIKKLQSIAGETKAINDLDILQQSYLLEWHKFPVGEVNSGKSGNYEVNSAIARLAGYVITEFQTEFGKEEGLKLADAVWQQHPFAVRDTVQAQKLAQDFKLELKGKEWTVEAVKDSSVLAKASMQNLTFLQSLLQTEGMNAGFLHKTIKKEDGSIQKALLMGKEDVETLKHDVDQLINGYNKDGKYTATNQEVSTNVAVPKPLPLTPQTRHIRETIVQDTKEQAKQEPKAQEKKVDVKVDHAPVKLSFGQKCKNFFKGLVGKKEEKKEEKQPDVEIGSPTNLKWKFGAKPRLDIQGAIDLANGATMKEPDPRLIVTPAKDGNIRTVEVANVETEVKVEAKVKVEAEVKEERRDTTAGGRLGRAAGDRAIKKGENPVEASKGVQADFGQAVNTLQENTSNVTVDNSELPGKKANNNLGVK